MINLYDRTLAPEVGSDVGYSFSVDYYGLGSLAYELVVGFPPSPWMVKNKSERLVKNQRHRVSFPDHLSAELQDFLKRLLDENPKLRLGANGGLNEIKKHPWLHSVRFIDICNQISPPVIEINPLVKYFEIKNPLPRTVDNFDAIKFYGSSLKDTNKIPGFEFVAPADNPLTHKRYSLKNDAQNTHSLQKKPAKLHPLNNWANFNNNKMNNPSLKVSTEGGMSCEVSKRKMSLTQASQSRSNSNSRRGSENQISPCKIQLTQQFGTSKFRPNIQMKVRPKLQTVLTGTVPKRGQTAENAEESLNYNDQMDENYCGVDQSLSIKIRCYQSVQKHDFSKRYETEPNGRF